jgi:hypothetical protein
MIVAHGIGGRSDLPVPTSLAAFGAAAAVLVSFAALGAWWRTARLRGDEAGRPLPAGLARLLDAPALRAAIRMLAVLVFAFTIVLAFAGPDSSTFNLAPYLLYITVWVGLVPASLLFGPVLRIANPLRAVHGALARVGRLDRRHGVLGPPTRIGMWPAAGFLLVFAWMELVLPHRDRPVIVGVFLVVYTVVHVWLALLFGDGWFACGDGFEVWSSLVARLSPFGRRADGRLVVRNPLDGLAGQPVLPGLVAVVTVIVGSTAFDGVTRTRWWNDSVPSDAVGRGTLGLAGCVAVVALAYRGACLLSAIAARRTPAGQPAAQVPPTAAIPGMFAATLVPIGIGYTVAHYFSLFVLDGQAPLALISDPFARGWNLFGTAHREVDYGLVGPTTIAWVQVLAVVAGHVLAVISAHDRSLRVMTPPAAATRSQYPMLVLMVGLTCAAIALLVGT